jgi:hypothetical protein
MSLSGHLLVGWLATIVALSAPSLAEDAPRRVGSLIYFSGEVTYLLRVEPGEPSGADVGNWLSADFDQPVCQDMSLKTGAKARALIRIGPNGIGISDDTLLNILNLTDEILGMSVPYGQIHLELSEIKSDNLNLVEIEMPRGSLWVLQAGAYDINIGNGNQPTRIIVFEGKARFIGGQADVPIAAGEEVRVTGQYPESIATVRSAVDLPVVGIPAVGSLSLPQPTNQHLPSKIDQSNAEVPTSIHASQATTILVAQTAALREIRETAADICYTVQQQGQDTADELSSEVQAKVDGAIGKITKLGLSGTGHVQSSEYQGVLHDQLATSLIHSGDCKKAVFDRLVEKMLPSIASSFGRQLSVGQK